MFQGFTILDEDNDDNTRKRKRNEQTIKESKKFKVEDEEVEEEVGEEKDERVKRIRVEELEDTDNSTVRVLTREEVEMFVTPIYELRNLVKENQEMKLGLLTLFHERLLQKGKINVLRETLRDQLTHPLAFIHPLPSFDSRQINICQAIPRYD